MSIHHEDRTCDEPGARLGLLVRAVVGGFGFGALALGMASFFAADSSDLLSPEEQAMFGVFLGAIGGALAGLLIWTAVVVAQRCYRLFQRALGRRN